MSEPKPPAPPAAPGSPPARVSRRNLLQGAGAAAVTVAVGCGDTGAQATSVGSSSTSVDSSTGSSTGVGSGGSGGAGGSPSGTGGNPSGTGGDPSGTGGDPSSSGTGTGGTGGAGTGASCSGDGGLSPEALLAPIETIVVLCMENRSFDHYLGSLALLEGKLLDGLDGTESNPAPDGTEIPVHQLDDFTVDSPPHGWDACHEQWNLGLNDGFVIAHAGSTQNDAMGYHVRDQLKTTYALADASTVCDRWFASVMGPTWPNRFYLHGATSGGQKANIPVVGFDSIFELLDDAGVSHTNYYHDVAWCSGGYFKLGGLAPIEKFFDAAQAGTLPSYCLIDPQFFGNGANDDHPDHDVQLGQALIATVYQALAQSPQWEKVLFVVIYDEHGGFFDHVPPPTTVDEEPGFEQLGFRIPALVAGPYARKGCVVSTPFEHVSVLRTLQRRFGLPSLNARMDAASDLSSCIDPAYLNDPQPPTSPPPVEVSLSQVFRNAPRRESQEELWAMAELGLIPPWLDRRAEGDAIARRVLAHGVRLGAVRLVR